MEYICLGPFWASISYQFTNVHILHTFQHKWTRVCTACVISTPGSQKMILVGLGEGEKILDITMVCGPQRAIAHKQLYSVSEIVKLHEVGNGRNRIRVKYVRKGTHHHWKGTV